MSATLETFLDSVQSGRIDYVRDMFKADEPRRTFLRSVGWGVYEPPSPMKPPTVPSYAPRLSGGLS